MYLTPPQKMFGQRFESFTMDGSKVKDLLFHQPRMWVYEIDHDVKFHCVDKQAQVDDDKLYYVALNELGEDSNEEVFTPLRFGELVTMSECMKFMSDLLKLVNLADDFPYACVEGDDCESYPSGYCELVRLAAKHLTESMKKLHS